MLLTAENRIGMAHYDKKTEKITQLAARFQLDNRLDSMHYFFSFFVVMCHAYSIFGRKQQAVFVYMPNKCFGWRFPLHQQVKMKQYRQKN